MMNKTPFFLVILLAAIILSACDDSSIDLDKVQLDLQATQRVIDAQTALKYTQAAAPTQTAIFIQAQQTETAATATQIAIATATSAQVTMEARHTQEVWQITKSAIESEATATQGARYLQATQAAKDAQRAAEIADQQAELAKLAVEREKTTNQVRAILPFALPVVLIIIVVIIIWRYSNVEIERRKWIEKDVRGDAPLRYDNGVIIDPDRQPGGQMVLSNRSLLAAFIIAMAKTKFGIDLQEQTNKDIALYTQENVTLRDQGVDYQHRGFSGDTQSRSKSSNQLESMQKPKIYKIYDGTKPKELTNEISEILDADWEEENE